MSSTSHAAFQAATANPQFMAQSQAAMEAILSRSATDRVFRGKLLDNPRVAIAELTGREIPETLNVRFIEKQGTATFVLPAVVDAAAPLNDAELEAVAGGSPALIAIAVGSSAECAVTVVDISLAVSGWLVEDK